MTTSITQHYSDNLSETELMQQLRECYPEGPSVYQLAPIDQLHIGGIKASEKLLQRLTTMQPQRILEIGSGLGGLLRLIAERRSDCSLIGLDITHRFNHLNQLLSGLTHPPHAATTLTADAQQLPFTDGSVDCIILQHSLLNIPDTHTCLTECRRVLSPGGSLLLHEVLQGPHPEQMRYPVPWATSQGHSHLISIDSLTATLNACGFHCTVANNWSEEALAWRQRQSDKENSPTAAQTASPLSPHQILGEQFREMGPNVMRNLTSGAVEVWEVVATPMVSGL